ARRQPPANSSAGASATGSGRTIRMCTPGSERLREVHGSGLRRVPRDRQAVTIPGSRENMIISAPTRLLAEFAADVRRDLALAPKQLQSKYLYDALGSSLFEAICRLPWYRITRAESGLLTTHAREVVTALGE